MLGCYRRLLVFLMVVLLGAVSLNFSYPSKAEAYTMTQIQFTFTDYAGNFAGTGIIRCGAVTFGEWYSIEDLPDYDSSYMLVTYADSSAVATYFGDINWEDATLADGFETGLKIEKNGDVYPVSFKDMDDDVQWPGFQPLATAKSGVIGYINDGEPNYANLTLYMDGWYDYEGDIGSWVAGAWFDDPDPANTPVPVPATLILLGTGLAGLAGFRRKIGKS